VKRVDHQVHLLYAPPMTTDRNNPLDVCQSIPEANRLYVNLFHEAEDHVRLAEDLRLTLIRLSGAEKKEYGKPIANDMPTTRELRAWATAQGITLESKGRIPSYVVVRYREAHDLPPLEGVKIDSLPVRVRRWAREQKIEVNRRGKIPADIIAQYEAAQKA